MEADLGSAHPHCVGMKTHAVKPRMMQIFIGTFSRKARYQLLCFYKEHIDTGSFKNPEDTSNLENIRIYAFW